ncbi:ABC transporter permease [Chitinophaga pendula]|uniref:ABC transporter permease n=1 Tax=Chitinophaga TaxID=79328 RepID=UPI000BAEE279|nr:MULTISPECIES: ABC transporter permease [Chitinophaga]ASZ13657.1 cell division protein FtsX [Chitinophaga sp. MD30]UCJ08718.1 ABC transporter permease [Chitinophaga pendula]
MITNYLKIAWRNLVKNKTFSYINIVGLAISIASFLLITSYVLDELSYDKFNRDADRIYRINSKVSLGGGDVDAAVSDDMIGQLLKADYPQVEQFTRIYNEETTKLIKRGVTNVSESRVAFVDSTFFDVFTLPAISGDLKTALNEPNTVVITKSMAKKYFGTTDVVGKTIETTDNGSSIYKVNAVIEDMPRNSHFNFDFLFPMKNLNYNWGQFTNFNFHTYLKLAKGVDYKSFEKKLDEYINKYVLPYVQQFIKINSMEELKKSGNSLEYSLIPLTQIHLYSNLSSELAPNGNIQFVYIFAVVALFILVIACINFMNLATACSSKRTKEVGIRKVLGTEKRELIFQFLAESILTASLSLILAIGLTWLSLPVFNDIAGKSISITFLFSPAILIILLTLPFWVGILAGAYPAFYLSGFKPIEVLKGKLSSGSSGGGLRSILVVFQFATSILLIIGTIVIYKQLSFIQSKDLGFNKDQILIVNNTQLLGNNVDAFKDEVLRIKGVSNGTISSFLPVNSSSRSGESYFKEATLDVKNSLHMQNWEIDYTYIPTMGMELLKGRNFSRNFNDSNSVIINETAAKLLGYDDPVGKRIYTNDANHNPISYNIIGVVKNFNFESLRQNIGALSFFLNKNTGLESFRLNTKDVNPLISSIEEKWKSMAPGMPFSYRFMDDSFNDMYRDEQRVGKLGMIFSLLAIFIACLGLFGLATFIAQQRTREIGIRKVLGASAESIVRLLSKDFLRLVIIAFIIASPIAWLFMDKWLQGFAYRVGISWWIFIVAAVMVLLIALATVSFQAIKVAVANPLKSIRPRS